MEVIEAKGHGDEGSRVCQTAGPRSNHNATFGSPLTSTRTSESAPASVALPTTRTASGALPVILFCFAVEVVLNAALLMDVNAFGLIGSTVQMGLISAVNVLMGALAMGALVRPSPFSRS